MKPAIRNRNFHLPLPEDLHRRLRAEAERQGLPATEVAREAIRSALRARQRERIDAEISRYARAVAGTRSDLDEDLEAASIDHLLAKRR
jgi:hypothetical protein